MSERLVFLEEDEETPGNSLSFLAHLEERSCEDTMRWGLLERQEKTDPSKETNLAGTLISDFKPLELGESKFQLRRFSPQ